MTSAGFKGRYSIVGGTRWACKTQPSLPVLANNSPVFVDSRFEAFAHGFAGAALRLCGMRPRPEYMGALEISCLHPQAGE